MNDTMPTPAERIAAMSIAELEVAVSDFNEEEMTALSADERKGAKDIASAENARRSQTGTCPNCGSEVVPFEEARGTVGRCSGCAMAVDVNAENEPSGGVAPRTDEPAEAPRPDDPEADFEPTNVFPVPEPSPVE